jgi:hypothetical protein
MPFLVDRERDIQVAEDVRIWLANQTIGGIQPVAVQTVRQEDASGEDAWVFVVELPDPDPKSGTWPVETLNEFARVTRDRAIESDLSWPWYIVFFPESDEEQEDEDNEDQLTLPDG